MNLREKDGTQNDNNRGEGGGFLNDIVDGAGSLPSILFCLLYNSRRISSSSRSSIRSRRREDGNDKYKSVNKNNNDNNTNNKNENVEEEEGRER